MVDISSQNNKINITVSSSGNTANANVSPDYAQYYSEKSKEWAISEKLIDNEDYSSKHYANESKKQADISTAKATEVIESGNTAVSNIESARDNAITDITNQENISVENVNTAGVTQISSINTAGITQVANVNSAGTTQINLAKEQVTLATNQASIATEQATIATNKTSEVVASGNEALSNIDTAKSEALTEIETLHSSSVTDITSLKNTSITDITNLKNTSISDITTAKDNAITSITNQETTSKTVLIDEGATQIGLIQNEGATQVANVQSTGFYMRDDKLYFINSQGEETEFKSGGGGGLEVCDIGMALYVDETKGLRRYLNGQIVDINTNTQAFLDRLKDITTLHPSLLCTEEEWQTAKTMSAFGQVGKFVFNYSGNEIVSVRIPRVVNVQGLFDLQNLGMTVGAGLPNITGNWNRSKRRNVITSVDTLTGAFTKTQKGTYLTFGDSGSSYSGGDLTFDASRSNSIYGNSNTVQPEAIQYPYFIQIATGSETEANIINEIELNNPYSLFDSKYSDHELNNLSWLKSEGQWNAKAVYPSAYDKLLKVYNGTETVAGLSVKLSTETYTDYDFVLNTAEETFRLPLLDGSEDLPSAKKYIYELPTSGGQQYTALYNGIIQLNAFSSAPNQYVSLINTTTGEYDEMRTPISNASNVCNIQVKAGDTFTVNGDNISTIKWLANIKYVGNGSLYFYVGETVQNANLIDAGRIGEKLADCITRTDCKAYITETYVNGTSWYRVYSDGWCEQGGRLSVSSNQTVTITFLKPFVNTNYIAFKNLGIKSTGTSNAQELSCFNFTTTTMQTQVNADHSYSCWIACGYLA